jgi:hypothetical protein
MIRRLKPAVVILLVAVIALSSTHGFSSISSSMRTTSSSTKLLLSSSSPNNAVDPDKYNIDLDSAAKLWKASVSPDNTNMRDAGIPYLDVTSKDYFVDDVDVIVSRNGGMGMELLELAGGRSDGFGITIVTGVSGNAQAAGILPGDSISSIAVTTTTSASLLLKGNTAVEETTKVAGCECLDFDRTMDVLANFAPPAGEDAAEEVVLSLKRIRRWPKVRVTVEYPPSQCAEGVDSVKEIELFAGENLKRALQNRGIVLDDPQAPKCDFCGGKCTVSVSRGMKVLNPIGITESKLMARNPTCRVSSTRTQHDGSSKGLLVHGRAYLISSAACIVFSP